MPYADTALFGYVPNEGAAIFGIVYFGTACVAVVAQMVFGPYKFFWLSTLALAALGETIGWGCRLWAHNAPLNWMAYTIQLCSLVVTPVFISASDYLLFSTIIAKSNTRLFSLPNRCYWMFFIFCDIVSLAIQTVGAVEVSNLSVLESGNPESIKHGNNILRSGIAFQLSNTVMFSILILAAILWQRSRSQTTLLELAGWPIMFSISLSTVMLLIRNAFRVFELGGGYNNSVMRTERYLIGWDMVPMAVAIGILTVFSPCCFLAPAKRESLCGSYDGVIELGHATSVQERLG